MHRLVRGTIGMALLASAAACNDDIGLPSGFLNPADAAGVYQACTLRFVPTDNSLAAVDLLVSVVDTTPPANGTEPLLEMFGNGSFTLRYTRLSDAFTRVLGGGAGFAPQALLLPLPEAVRDDLLLPAGLELAFSPSPKRLTAGAGENSEFDVDRVDYARSAGVAEAGLPVEIPGRVTATFSTGACP